MCSCPELLEYTHAPCLAQRLRAAVLDSDARACCTCSGSAQDWAALVPRFRALRESLLSLGADGSLVSAALEASADACARAGDWAEFLKAAQQLVLSVYPALAAQEQVCCFTCCPCTTTLSSHAPSCCTHASMPVRGMR